MLLHKRIYSILTNTLLQNPFPFIFLLAPDFYLWVHVVSRKWTSPSLQGLWDKTVGTFHPLETNNWFRMGICYKIVESKCLSGDFFKIIRMKQLSLLSVWEGNHVFRDVYIFFLGGEMDIVGKEGRWRKPDLGDIIGLGSQASWKSINIIILCPNKLPSLFDLF